MPALDLLPNIGLIGVLGIGGHRVIEGSLTLGSLVAIFPPVLFAFIQFDGFTMPLLVLAGVGGIQLVMGQFVDPRLEGKYLELSPLVVLFSVAFWGWMWGIAGAFIGVPITVALVIACNQFERTRWIAALLADVDQDEER